VGDTKAVSWWDRLGLVGKYSVLLGAVALAIAPAVYFTLDGLLTPAFQKIETQQVVDQQARARHALASLQEGLKSSVLDYAKWDPMYAYVISPNRALEAETMTPTSYENMGIDLMAVVRTDGKILWSDASDRATNQVLPAETKTFASLLGSGPLFEDALAHQDSAHFVKTARGVYAVHASWVRKSSGTGAIKGFLVMGILLGEKDMSEALQVKSTLDLHPTATKAARIIADKNHVLITAENRSIDTALGLVGYDGALLASIEYQTPRSITAAGSRAITLAATAMIVGFLILAGLIGWAIRRVAVTRLQALEKHVRTFRSDGTAIDARLTHGSDEVASLAQGFQSLTEELNLAEAQLREQYYVQGKADSAAGLLHNVRNAIAPVRVMQEKWVREESLPYRVNLKKALDELASGTVDPARGADLQRFVVSAARKLIDQGDGRKREFIDMQESVDQIAAILSSYDLNTTMKAKGEDTDIDTLALITREAKQLIARTAGRITIDLPSALPHISANPVQLAQIVSNLFINALESMEAGQVSDMRLVVAGQVADDGKALILRIKDNGEGIEAATLKTLFDRGFSTRPHKSGGIGLHWCANAIRIMGGSLTIESGGKGQGATAVLVLKAAAVALPLALCETALAA
jgi:signal transduction histidine kinase